MRVSQSSLVAGKLLVSGLPKPFPISLTFACAAVIAFSEVMADASQHGKYALSLYDAGRCMRLDAAAQRALNVLPQRTDANDSFSLYGLLNRGRTTMARRLLKASLPEKAFMFV